jgi:hypothetical protein
MRDGKLTFSFFLELSFEFDFKQDHVKEP